MNRCLMFVIALLCCSTSAAGEYLIRVDVVGYEDAPVTEKVPAETVLRSIKVIARPNEPFRRSVRMGQEALTLEGVLRPQSDGSFSLKIKSFQAVDTGLTVPAPDGTEEPVLDQTECGATITVRLGRPTLLGGIETKSTEIVAGQERHVESKRHHILTIRKRVTESHNKEASVMEMIQGER